MEIKIFALRLRQYANSLEDISNALNRVEEYEDDDFSPSKYTPSRNKSRENLNKIGSIIHGYCIAVDDALNRDHGITEGLFYQAKEKGLHLIKPYTKEELEYLDNDSGYSTSIEMDRESEADEIFCKVLKIN